MSTFSENKRGWKYDFVRKGRRYQSGYYRTKSEAMEAEAKKKEELKHPHAVALGAKTGLMEKTRTDMAFLDLINRRLDHVRAYNSRRHYNEYKYLARRWTKRWHGMMCSEISREMAESFILERAKVSKDTANKEIRYLKATFNFGKRKGLIPEDPITGIEFFPVEKSVRYVPSSEDIDRVIAVADSEMQDYLWTIRDTFGRMNEVNSLRWDDVDFLERTLTLYTRKKKGGNLTPRKVPMTNRLHGILSRRFAERDKSTQWIFWHTYWSKKTGEFVKGPYSERKRSMKTLCRKAGVRYFRYHALRHAGASLMDNNNVPLGAIQKILGHENRTTTEIYLHTIGNIERHAIQVFETASKNSLSDSLSTKKSGLANQG